MDFAVQGRRERPSLSADVRQRCGIGGKHPNYAIHKRRTTVEKAKVNGPALAQDGGKAPLHDRPATRDKLVEQVRPPTLVRPVGPEQKVRLW